MAPYGITNHFSRIHIPGDPLGWDADFEQLMVRICAELMMAVNRAMTAKPDYLVMGMSSKRFGAVRMGPCNCKESSSYVPA